MIPIYRYASSFTSLYEQTFNYIIKNGEKSNPRGFKVIEVAPAVLALGNPVDRLLCFNKMRNIKKYCYGEALWYLSGSNDLDFISKYSKFWNKISDDGKTCNSAYGKYIFNDKYMAANPGQPFKMTNQWDFVKETLMKDSDSRQAIIHIKPIQVIPTKDTVCTLTMQFMIRKNKLNLIVNMRSNDFYKGLTYDVFQFTLLQELMAAELNVELGEYIHIANNLHIYEQDIPAIQDMINSGKRESELLPRIPADFREVDLQNLLNNEPLVSNFAKEFSKYNE